MKLSPIGRRWMKNVRTHVLRSERTLWCILVVAWNYTCVLCNIIKRKGRKREREMKREMKREMWQGNKGGAEDIETTLLKIAEGIDCGYYEDCSYNLVLRSYSYGDNSILRMILVAITSKLPWSGLFLAREPRSLSRARLKRRALRGEEKGILLLITE